MSRTATRPAILLALAGVVLLVACAAGVSAGLLLAERIYALLPPVTIDAAAVGGATVALGVAAGLLGLLHLALAVALRRAVLAAVVPTIVLCATMAVLAISWAVAALVSSASGSGPPAAMVGAGIGLVLVAAAYAWSGAILIGLRSGPTGPR